MKLVVNFIGFCRQDDDAQRRLNRVQASGQGKPIFARQVDIDDGQVHVVVVCLFVKSFSRFNALRMVTKLAQNLDQAGLQRKVVFNHQNIQSLKHSTNLTSWGGDSHFTVACINSITL